MHSRWNDWLRQAENDLLDLFPGLDILVYTPREFEKLTSDPSPGFWKSAVAEMRQIL
jgi:hypothetical protein